MVVDCDPYHSAYGSHATRVVACSQATPWSRSDDGVLGGGGRPHRSSCSGNSAKALQCAIKLQRRAVDVRFRSVFAHRRPLGANQPRIGAASQHGRALAALRCAISRTGAPSRCCIAHRGPSPRGRRALEPLRGGMAPIRTSRRVRQAPEWREVRGHRPVSYGQYLRARALNVLSSIGSKASPSPDPSPSKLLDDQYIPPAIGSSGLKEQSFGNDSTRQKEKALAESLWHPQYAPGKDIVAAR